MKTFTHHAMGAAIVSAAYILYIGQVVYFTITYIGDRYMKYFM